MSVSKQVVGDQDLVADESGAEETGNLQERHLILASGDDYDDDDDDDGAHAPCCAPHNNGHYEAIVKAGWIIYWLEGVQLIFWFVVGIYICGFTTEKFAVAHILSALHFTGSLGVAEVTEHLERAMEKHTFPEAHFERSWGFLFLLTLLADVLLLLDVAVFLPRDQVAAFVLEMIIGGWAMLTGIVIFVWAIIVAIQAHPKENRGALSNPCCAAWSRHAYYISGNSVLSSWCVHILCPTVCFHLVYDCILVAHAQASQHQANWSSCRMWLNHRMCSQC